jgi:hypothetical protein
MRKIVVTVALVFIFFSCRQEEEPEYLTITYHSEGHTSGEVPVDPKKYTAPRWSDDFPPVIIETEEATVLGPGTLEKEGCVWGGWRYRHPEGGYYEHEYNSHGLYSEGEIIKVHHDVDFEAYWHQ